VVADRIVIVCQGSDLPSPASRLTLSEHDTMFSIVFGAGQARNADQKAKARMPLDPFEQAQKP
jgi:hypothetical protein